jgi:hypothetical protein
MLMFIVVSETDYGDAQSSFVHGCYSSQQKADDIIKALKRDDEEELDSNFVTVRYETVIRELDKLPHQLSFNEV